MRQLWKIIAAMLATLAGVQLFSSCPRPPRGDTAPAYGVPVAVRSFKFQPAGPIHVGDTVTFFAEIPEGLLSDISVCAGASGEQRFVASLSDFGEAPDAVAGDRVYTGEVLWQAGFGTGRMETRLLANIKLNGKRTELSHDGPPLEVLP